MTERSVEMVQYPVREQEENFRLISRFGYSHVTDSMPVRDSPANYCGFEAGFAERRRTNISGSFRGPASIIGTQDPSASKGIEVHMISTSCGLNHWGERVVAMTRGGQD